MSEVVEWEQFAKDLAANFGIDFVRDFCASITDEMEAERELAYARQRKIAAASRQLEQCFMDGLGECHMRVDAEVFWNWVHREGREIWNQKDFIKRFKADNPDVRVLTKSRKTMIVRP